MSIQVQTRLIVSNHGALRPQKPKGLLGTGQFIDDHVELNVLRRRADIFGTTLFIVSLLVEWCFTSTETVGLLGTGTQDVHLDFHTAPELSDIVDDNVELNVLGCRVDILGTNCDQCRSMVQCCFMSTETVRPIKTGSPGRPPRLSHSS